MERLTPDLARPVDWYLHPIKRHPLDRALTPAQIHAAHVQTRYFANSRATTQRLLGELRSPDNAIRRAAVLRLVRRLGFEGARDVWRTASYSRNPYALARDWRFRRDCQMAAGAILAGAPR